MEGAVSAVVFEMIKVTHDRYSESAKAVVSVYQTNADLLLEMYERLSSYLPILNLYACPSKNLQLTIQDVLNSSQRQLRLAKGVSEDAINFFEDLIGEE